MVGCRYNAKNSLPKNYLFFAEKKGTQVLAEMEVKEIRPIGHSLPDGARYEVIFQPSTALFFRRSRTIQGRNVIVAAGVLGTLRLLLHCRDQSRTLPFLSFHLGKRVRTNSESLIGVRIPGSQEDLSKGIAIGSGVYIDEHTHIEAVRYWNAIIRDFRKKVNGNQ